MQRLFSGTKWDRPPTCDRCGRLESECDCPPLVVEPIHLPPQSQTAKIRLERRPKGKSVTTICNLSAEGNDLDGLTATLKSKCGSGGTVKEGVIEIQGDQLARVEATLKEIGYQVKRIS